MHLPQQLDVLGLWLVERGRLRVHIQRQLLLGVLAGRLQRVLAGVERGKHRVLRRRARVILEYFACMFRGIFTGASGCFMSSSTSAGCQDLLRCRGQISRISDILHLVTQLLVYFLAW